ncbi:hypothetical protein AXF19_02910 [Selenomonas sp. oral taxon 126]|nr:hypothetical protein AXF19_02910 [Selenomonas sp. oral taxon 126]
MSLDVELLNANLLAGDLHNIRQGKVYFAHPYSSWERSQNERHNGILRQYIPKGTGIDGYSDEDILNIADEINRRPRRVLGYQTLAELFRTFLDEVYAIENVS